jgi:hypothetical protein
VRALDSSRDDRASSRRLAQRPSSVQHTVARDAVLLRPGERCCALLIQRASASEQRRVSTRRRKRRAPGPSARASTSGCARRFLTACAPVRVLCATARAVYHSAAAGGMRRLLLLLPCAASSPPTDLMARGRGTRLTCCLCRRLLPAHEHCRTRGVARGAAGVDGCSAPKFHASPPWERASGNLGRSRATADFRYIAAWRAHWSLLPEPTAALGQQAPLRQHARRRRRAREASAATAAKHVADARQAWAAVWLAVPRQARQRACWLDQNGDDSRTCMRTLPRQINARLGPTLAG